MCGHFLPPTVLTSVRGLASGYVWALPATHSADVSKRTGFSLCVGTSCLSLIPPHQRIGKPILLSTHPTPLHL